MLFQSKDIRPSKQVFEGEMFGNGLKMIGVKPIYYRMSSNILCILAIRHFMTNDRTKVLQIPAKAEIRVHMLVQRYRFELLSE